MIYNYAAVPAFRYAWLPLLQALAVSAGANGSASGNGTAPPVDPAGPPGPLGWPHEKLGTVQTRFHDAHVGMVRLLVDGYGDKEKYQAALNVVQFITRAFGKDEGAMFEDLMHKLTVKRDLEPAEFKSIMNDWVAQFNGKLVFCKTSSCAVWELFHGIAALLAIGYAPILVSEALPKFRYMVSEFLSCEKCRQHFMASYDACSFGRCEVLAANGQAAQAEALMLWLWRVHNAVSVQAAAEQPSRWPGVDRRWPAPAECPGCWRASVVNGAPGKLLTFAGQAGDAQPTYAVFNESRVASFMISTYLGQDNYVPQRKVELEPITERGAWVYSPHTGVVALSCALSGILVLFLAIRFRARLPCPAEEEEALGTMYDEMVLLPSAELVG